MKLPKKTGENSHTLIARFTWMWPAVVATIVNYFMFGKPVLYPRLFFYRGGVS